MNQANSPEYWQGAVERFQQYAAEHEAAILRLEAEASVERNDILGRRAFTFAFDWAKRSNPWHRRRVKNTLAAFRTTPKISAAILERIAIHRRLASYYRDMTTPGVKSGFADFA